MTDISRGVAQAGLQHRSASNALTINLAPLSLSTERLRVGRVPYLDRDAYAALRAKHRATHAFRFDASSGDVINIALSPGGEPLGTTAAEPACDHLLLIGKAVQRTMLLWLEPQYAIARASRPIVFWGRKDRSLLLSSALNDLGLPSAPGIEVVGRFALDTRVIDVASDDRRASICLLLDADTANVIDVPVSHLLERGVDVDGLYVCRRAEPEEGAVDGGEVDDEGADELADDLGFASGISPGVRARLQALGQVRAVTDGDLLLVDAEGADRVDAASVLIEPRQENLEMVLRALYPRDVDRIVAKLRAARGPFITAPGRLATLTELLRALQRRISIVLGDGFRIEIGDFLADGDPSFPSSVSTSRPTCLFGAQGRETDEYPDRGIQRFGPYKYMQHDRNEPTIAIVCEAKNLGPVEQFVEALRHGVTDEAWAAANTWRSKDLPTNPFRSGLVGKFRLQRVRVEYETIRDLTPAAYREGIERVLARLPDAPHLGLVQTRTAFQTRHGNDNAYLVAKAAFMSAGIPVQAVQIETIQGKSHEIPYRLNNLALAIYAKLNGTPWVIATQRPTSHEIVIGLGYTEVGGRSVGRRRYVGITTLFQGDGRYLVWGRTREVEFSNYAEALLENLRSTIDYVRAENNWQAGDQVRLVFHVYKPLKHIEIDAIRELVTGLIATDHQVSFAFLDISRRHDLRLFDPRSLGKSYSTGGGRRATKGEGVPVRGLCLQLGERTALIQLAGPSDMKTAEQGAPRALKLDLHPYSDFDDLAYLVRQVYHFSYLSWRSFFPGTEPVSIAYSRRIANMLGNLKPVTGWDSRVLTVGGLRNSKWFL
jgi:hypothetical protein